MAHRLGQAAGNRLAEAIGHVDDLRAASRLAVAATKGVTAGPEPLRKDFRDEGEYQEKLEAWKKTKAFLDLIPGPPPKEVSSVVRCLSAAKSRMSCTRTSIRPSAMAFPSRLSQGRFSSNLSGAGTIHAATAIWNGTLSICRARDSVL